ncbi:hypothetical protein IFM89_028254 [Coptis chinensis]|uniref:SHSP domain-containing protein n=1 Tax=Coptis chinensis TaxID=261450 RepID=A0A835IQB5_9MAGN|nr:hypothetical protein IFM89_028254 [Coptis chinensis]
MVKQEMLHTLCHVRRWNLPNANVTKVNTDGATKNNPGLEKLLLVLLVETQMMSLPLSTIETLALQQTTRASVLLYLKAWRLQSVKVEHPFGSNPTQGQCKSYKDSESVSLGLSIGGWRSTRRRVRVEENESEELVSNVRDADEVDKETKPSLSGETGDGDALETSLGLGEEGSGREEKGKGILDLNLPPEEQPEPKLRCRSCRVELVFCGRKSSKRFFGLRPRDRLLVLFSCRKLRESERKGVQEEEEEEINVAAPSTDELPEIEDRPGPFSTAMKIIKDEATKLNGGRFELYKSPSLLYADVIEPVSTPRSIGEFFGMLGELADQPRGKNWSRKDEDEAMQLKIDMPGLGKEHVKVLVEEDPIIKGEADLEAGSGNNYSTKFVGTLTACRNSDSL